MNMPRLCHIGDICLKYEQFVRIAAAVVAATIVVIFFSSFFITLRFFLLFLHSIYSLECFFLLIRLISFRSSIRALFSYTENVNRDQRAANI